LVAMSDSSRTLTGSANARNPAAAAAASAGPGTSRRSGGQQSRLFSRVAADVAVGRVEVRRGTRTY